MTGGNARLEPEGRMTCIAEDVPIDLECRSAADSRKHLGFWLRIHPEEKWVRYRTAGAGQERFVGYLDTEATVYLLPEVLEPGWVHRPMSFLGRFHDPDMKRSPGFYAFSELIQLTHAGDLIGYYEGVIGFTESGAVAIVRLIEADYTLWADERPLQPHLMTPSELRAASSEVDARPELVDELKDHLWPRGR